MHLAILGAQPCALKGDAAIRNRAHERRGQVYAREVHKRVAAVRACEKMLIVSVCYRLIVHAYWVLHTQHPGCPRAHSRGAGLRQNTVCMFSAY